MADEVKEKPLASSAIKSLMMETRLAELFSRHGWDARTGTYYKDKILNKEREIDIYCVKIFDEPKEADGTGIPLILVHVCCECKSLSGLNFVFSSTRSPELENYQTSSWIGDEDHLRAIVSKVADELELSDHRKFKALYDYAVARALPSQTCSQNATAFVVWDKGRSDICKSSTDPDPLSIPTPAAPVAAAVTAIAAVASIAAPSSTTPTATSPASTVTPTAAAPTAMMTAASPATAMTIPGQSDSRKRQSRGQSRN